MMSDILCEARMAIEKDFMQHPEMYDDLQAEVTAVCAAMAALQMKLDNPFFALGIATNAAAGGAAQDAIDLAHTCCCAYWRGTDVACDCGRTTAGQESPNA